MRMKPRFKMIKAENVTVGMPVLAPAVNKVYRVTRITNLFDKTVHISLDDCNNRHLRRKPGSYVLVQML